MRHTALGGAVLLLLMGAHLLPAGPARASSSVIYTKHNLSMSGPGNLIAFDEERVCIFCHTPHHANPVAPLWSRESNGNVYDLYGSSTLQAAPGQPTGASRLCLSCHDGTVALGMLKGGYRISTLGAIPADRASNLGTDLSDDHPISFPYTAQLAFDDGELNDPVLLPPEIELEEGVYLQCTTCHDAHKDLYGKFVVVDNAASALCRACHNPAGWYASTHATHAGSAQDACKACHLSHNAGSSERLLKEYEEEQTCYPCHDEPGIESDVRSAFQRVSHHPVAAQAEVHDPAEDPLLAPYHVECADCHESHAANGDPAVAPDVGGALTGVSGVDLSGAVVDPAQYAYEICFKCHADNSHVPYTAVPRVVDERNLRLKFDPLSPSFHPVAGLVKAAAVPSLRPEYSVTSILYCADCHNTDDGTRAGGVGANGVHGSAWDPILVARYDRDTYPLAYTETHYALCFRCHDPAVLLDGSATAPFPPHQSHVTVHGAPCSACHDAHGVPYTGVTPAIDGTHLVNFDTRFVDPLTAAYDGAARSCTVSCHAANPQTY